MVSLPYRRNRTFALVGVVEQRRVCELVSVSPIGCKELNKIDLVIRTGTCDQSPRQFSRTGSISAGDSQEVSLRVLRLHHQQMLAVCHLAWNAKEVAFVTGEVGAGKADEKGATGHVERVDEVVGLGANDEGVDFVTGCQVVDDVRREH